MGVTHAPRARRPITLACLIAVAALALACGGIGTAQTQSASPVAAGSELRAAVIVSNPVLVTRGADGSLGGVSVELARAFAVKLGLPLRVIPYDKAP